MKDIGIISQIESDANLVKPDKSNEINITDIRAQLMQIQIFMAKILESIHHFEETLHVISKNMALINHSSAATNASLNQAEKLSKTVQQNVNDIRNMLGEFKGILCIVRPEVKKTGWYGEEVNLPNENHCVNIPQLPIKTNSSEIGRCTVDIDGVDRLGVTRKRLT